MGDIIGNLNHLDASPLVAILLVALCAALKWIGKGLVKRIETIEKSVTSHTTELAVIRTRIGMGQHSHED